MSKNYQVNYTVKVDDLTDVGTRNAIRNLKRLAEAQKLIDKDRVLNKQAAYQTIALAKAAKAQQESKKKQSLSELSGYRQLLAKKNALYKTDQLKRIRGDEQALRSYLSRQQNLSSRLKGSSFTDHAGKTTNINRQLEVTRRIHQAETMLGSAIAANTRKRERDLAVQKRQSEMLAQRRSEGQVAIGVAATAGLYAGGRGAAYAFGQTMTLEQMSIAMRAQFGVEAGNNATKEMKDYARDTAFTLKEATQLLLGVKIGADNIGIKDTPNMIAFTKEIGKSILAYGGNVEDRFEIGHQLSQVFMAGTADTRQDLKVIARRGLPIFEALKTLTGKDFKEIKEEYGAQIPASLVAKAVLLMSKSSEVLRAMGEREQSFTQSWESANEQFGYTAGAFGDMLAKATRLPSLLRGFTKAMSGIEDTLMNKGELTIGQKASTSALATGALLAGWLSVKGVLVGVNLLMLRFTGQTLLASLGLTSMGTAVATIGRKLVMFSGIASTIYLAMSDWKGLFDDLNKEGLSGLLKHLDKVVAVLAVLYAGFQAGGFIGLGIAATGLAAMGAYKKYQYNKKNEAEEAAAFSRVYKEGQTMTPAMTPWQSSPTFGRDVTMQKLFPKSEAPLMTPATPAVNIGISNIIEASTGKTKTTVNKSPNNIYNAWEKEYSFNGN